MKNPAGFVGNPILQQGKVQAASVNFIFVNIILFTKIKFTNVIAMLNGVYMANDVKAGIALEGGFKKRIQPTLVQFLFSNSDMNLIGMILQ